MPRGYRIDNKRLRSLPEPVRQRVRVLSALKQICLKIEALQPSIAGRTACREVAVMIVSLANREIETASVARRES